jgi:hypothetical protein
MRWLRRAGFAAILGAALFLYALPGMLSDESGALECLAPGDSRASLLAVGDVGQVPGYTGLFDTQLSVAAALDFEHRERPVDAFVLLGDNFYPRGLAEEDMPQRIRENLVRPYCRFMNLRGSRAALVAKACRLSPEQRQPVPFIAVLGNHDTEQPGSADLERLEVRNFISNWRMSRDLADATDLPGGVSVIHFDSVGLRAGEDIAPLVDALRASRGPWRILVGHHPLLEGGIAREDTYRDAILQALERAGVRAHLLLTGHEHNLQVGVTGLTSLPLQVIAGSGAGARAARNEVLGREFIRILPGYARVDLERTGGEERLVVSIMSAANYPFQFWRAPQWHAPAVEACWRITQDGDVAPMGSRSAATH